MEPLFIIIWVLTSIAIFFQSYAILSEEAYQKWFIKLGIAWFLCRLSNNLIKFGRLRHILFGYIVASFVCVVIIFWASCPPNDFVTETLASSPPSTSLS